MGKKLLFVHGTGVRNADYDKSVAKIQRRLADSGLDIDLVECRWGEALGARLDYGLSVPRYQESGGKAELSESEVSWNLVLHDPVLEMQQLNEAKRQPAPPDSDDREDVRASHAALAKARLSAFDEHDLGDLLPDAIATVQQDYAQHLGQARGYLPQGDLAEVLARATVARVYRLASEKNRDLPGRVGRTAMIDFVVAQLVGETRGVGGLLLKPFAHLATLVLTAFRGSLTHWAHKMLGDVLRYQARGADIRDFIADQIDALADEQVIVFAHSLGGIASLETLIEYRPTNVDLLVTFGSQAPLLFELGALSKLPPNSPLPDGLPLWLNFYDINDPFSYQAKDVFPKGVSDYQVNSGAMFLDAHSAYLDSDQMWTQVLASVKQLT
jgi:hypothetical protein